MAQSSLTYKVSWNGSAGNWYWEVRDGPEVVARGLAANEIAARVEAMTAATSYGGSAENIERSIGQEHVGTLTGELTVVKTPACARIALHSPAYREVSFALLFGKSSLRLQCRV